MGCMSWRIFFMSMYVKYDLNFRARRPGLTVMKSSNDDDETVMKSSNDDDMTVIKLSNDNNVTVIKLSNNDGVTVTNLSNEDDVIVIKPQNDDPRSVTNYQLVQKNNQQLVNQRSYNHLCIIRYWSHSVIISHNQGRHSMILDAFKMHSYSLST